MKRAVRKEKATSGGLGRRAACSETKYLLHTRLLEISLELRAIGFLIETHSCPGAVPMDRNDIYLGLGSVLSRLAGGIREIAEELDPAAMGSPAR